jgi:hypothetical protein
MTTQPLGDVFSVEALFSASPATLQQARYWANNGHADVAANLAAVQDAARRLAAAHARRDQADGSAPVPTTQSRQPAAPASGQRRPGSRQQAADQLAQRFPNRAR